MKLLCAFGMLNGLAGLDDMKRLASTNIGRRLRTMIIWNCVGAGDFFVSSGRILAEMTGICS